jgi:hypothetical protein
VHDIFLSIPDFADADTVEAVNAESWQAATGFLESATVFYRPEQE